MKRAVIIGSGLGGLSCGIVLASHGYRVSVLEQGAQTGGCLQCFQREGRLFETGMHYIGSLDPGQTLHRLLTWMGVLDLVRFSRLDPEGYNHIHIDGGEFCFANGREAFVETLGRDFPREKDGLLRYYDTVKQVANLSQWHHLCPGKNDLEYIARYQRLPAEAAVASMIGDPTLRDVLFGIQPILGGNRASTSFFTMAMIQDFYQESAFRIQGGSHLLARALQQRLEEAGGEVLTRQKAVKLPVQGDRVTGVETADGAFYPAEVVISDIAPSEVMAMIDSPAIRPAYRRRLESLPQTPSAFSLYLDFEPNTVPYENFNRYVQGHRWGAESDTIGEDLAASGGNPVDSYLYMQPCVEERPRYAQSAVLLCQMPYNKVQAWENSPLGRRGDDYEAFKQTFAQRLLERADRDLPGLKAATRRHYTATPLTYRHYTGSPQGSMYGLLKDVRLGPAAYVSHRTKLPNLLLTGQNTNLHGMMGVIISTLITCSDLIGADTLLQQINKK